MFYEYKVLKTENEAHFQELLNEADKEGFLLQTWHHQVYLVETIYPHEIFTAVMTKIREDGDPDILGTTLMTDDDNESK